MRMPNVLQVERRQRDPLLDLRSLLRPGCSGESDFGLLGMQETGRA